MADFGFNIEQVANILGLERSAGVSVNASIYNVKCPECNKLKLNINVAKGVWNCPRCGIGGGTLSLYVRFGLGERVYTKESGKKAMAEIKKQLGVGLNSEYKYNNSSTASDYIDDMTHLSDSQLDRVYSRMLKIPALRLLSEHKENLLKRGLTEEIIENNEYRSLPDRLYLPKGKRETLDEFKAEKLDVLYRERPELKRLGKRNIISGLYIGTYMHDYHKYNLENVPGFFQIKGIWCFKYTPGILIPVRNKNGEIVNLQIRTNSGKLRYITVSSKGFESGVSGGSRVHFPKNNPEIGPNTEIRITEGPLKADVALSMTKKQNIAYIAILGVNSTKDLTAVLKNLHDSHCKTVVNSLDMDKITNPNVAKAVKKIKKIVDSCGMNYRQLYWDSQTAEKVFINQNTILNDNDIKVEYKINDIFYKVLANTSALYQHNIQYTSEWPNTRSKGIDDYLLTRQT